VKGYQSRVNAINALEPELAALSNEALKARTVEFREQLANGKTLDDLLVPAFATVREAAKRTLGQRHFDVQLIGGMVLREGAIAEMRTGEGKTLVATLAVYLNALAGNGVHVVTVNDYLARRDAEWMGQIYRFLGMTVGTIVPNLSEHERRAAYECDITYATNNELGFDYLRDNMKHERSQMVHRPFNFALIDEVDSILIDEARTPLIISGPTDDKSELYIAVDAIVKQLVPEDYEGMKERHETSYYGLGVLVGMRNGLLTVISPLDGSPAQKVGIQPGDVISEIEGEPTEPLTMDEAIAKLKGPKDTAVHLTVNRRGLEQKITLVPVGLVKGLEVDSAFVVEPARIIAEEAQGMRALYVALTRATKRLCVVHAEPLPAVLLE
jgi:hypothetical protein